MDDISVHAFKTFAFSVENRHRGPRRVCGPLLGWKTPLHNGRQEFLAANKLHRSINDTVELGQTISLVANLNQIAINKNLTIDGLGLGITIDGGSAIRLFEVTNGAAVAINNLSLKNGFVSGKDGGAILVDAGTTLNLANDNFADNSAKIFGGITGSGGAIENHGFLTVTNSTFNNNSADQYGGAIDSDTTVKPRFGNMIVTGSTFTNNKATNPATSGAGGAISSADVTSIQTSTFTSNSSDDGGGGVFYLVLNLGGPPFVPLASSLTVDRSTFTTNTASAAGAFGGGAICVEVKISSGSMNTVVTNSTFSGNTTGATLATTGGGAVAIEVRTNAGPGGQTILLGSRRSPTTPFF